MSRWYPEVEGGPSTDVVTFAEEGKAPQVPAPLIRVPVGTTIEATVRNALPDSTLWIHWLAKRPGSLTDSVPILPGATRVFRFEAGAAGTYMYRGYAGKTESALRVEREQLVGAFVIDSVGARTDDRIFVLNIWSEPGDSARNIPLREALAINGKSWPFTERLNATTGDTLRWRVVNGTIRNHPMHLHGFYYNVDARGSAMDDTTYATGASRLVVTEDMTSFTTMSMRWVPERPGNWLFHCHLSFHVVSDARLDPPAHSGHSSDPREHMGGLVLGIAVRPDATYREPQRAKARRINMFVDEGKRRRLAERSLGFVQQRGPERPASDSVEIPGTTIVLTRGEATDIAVTNRMKEPTAVHWHGIELESFSDGVAGWSGANKRMAPAIAPGKTFIARLTLPRAGTFIYHTHLNDIEQLTSGLYGAIVVLEPGQKLDPETDHVYVASWDGDGLPRQAQTIVNGDSVGPDATYRAGVSHRFRFVNIGPANRLVFEFRRDGAPVRWTPFAKDGADLPPREAVVGVAAKRLGVGETFDAVVTPAPGEYMFVVRLPLGTILYRQRIVFK
jgi:FtsP/CotA-like multicopper oxidase with cupredoxin domain